MALEPYQSVNQTEGPPPRGWCQLFAYDANSLVEYQGWAQSLSVKTEWSRDSARLTSIVVSSDVATVTTGVDHGLQSGNRVFVINCTDADMNTSSGYVITVIDATSFSFATTNVADGTYNQGGLVLYTFAPPTNAPIWSIKRYFYDANSLIERISWAEGQPETAKFAWDSRTTYAYH